MPISISITYIIHITCIYTISYLPVDHLNFQDPGPGENQLGPKDGRRNWVKSRVPDSAKVLDWERAH